MEYNLPPRAPSPSLLKGYNRPITPPPRGVNNFVKPQPVKKAEPVTIDLLDDDSDGEDIKIEFVDPKIEECSDDEVEYLGFQPPDENNIQEVENNGVPRKKARTEEIINTVDSSSSLTPSVDTNASNLAQTCLPIPQKIRSNNLPTSSSSASVASSCIPPSVDLEPEPVRIGIDKPNLSTEKTADLPPTSASEKESSTSAFKKPINESSILSFPPHIFSTSSGEDTIYQKDGVFLKKYTLSEVIKDPSAKKIIPEVVSNFVQTGASMVNGEPVKKIIEDVTAPSTCQTQTDTSMNDASSSIPPEKSQKEKEKSKRHSDDRKKSSSHKKDKTSERRHSSESRSGDHHRHRSESERERDRREKDYLKRNKRRHSVRESEQRIVHPVPLFTTVEELIQVIKMCNKCQTRFDTRRDAVDHQKKHHNKKHCPVCFRLLTLKGNAWKDHLTKYHAIEDKELARCPFCTRTINFEGMYIHISRVHVKNMEDSGTLPTISKELPILNRETDITDFLSTSQVGNSFSSIGSRIIAEPRKKSSTSKSPPQQSPQNSRGCNIQGSLPKTSTSTRPNPQAAVVPTPTYTTPKKLSFNGEPGVRKSHVSASATALQSPTNRASEASNCGRVPSNVSTSVTVQKTQTNRTTEASNFERGPSSTLTSFISNPSPIGAIPNAKKPQSPRKASELSAREFTEEQLKQLTNYYRGCQTPHQSQLLMISNSIEANVGAVRDWFLKTYRKECQAKDKAQAELQTKTKGSKSKRK